MTAENVAVTAAVDDECRDCGYEPELKRTLGPFQVFAMSFAFISVAVGIYATYDDVLQNAGPVGIWLWILAGGVYFAKMLIFNREVLDTEPGVDIFAAAPAMSE
jgi:hypothetical protein